MPRLGKRVRRSTVGLTEDFSPTQVADMKLLELGRSQIYDYIRAGTIKTEPDEWGHARITRAEITRLQTLWQIDPAAHPDKTLLQAAARAANAKGGHQKAARHSKEEIHEPMRLGQREKWIQEIDPDRRLPSEELERRLAQKQAVKMEDMRRKRFLREALREQYSNHSA